MSRSTPRDQPLSGKGRDALWAKVFPSLVFLVLAMVTVGVWGTQVEHRHALLERHTEDVGAQAARRLELFVESHLRVAEIFAQRWSTHETQDFSQRRFQRFAQVLLEELPGFAAIGLIPAGQGASLAFPETSAIVSTARLRRYEPILGASVRDDRPVLSPPFVDEVGAESVLAVLPLRVNEGIRGHLVVEFHTETLIRDCFHSRIRSEFHFWVEDDRQRLFMSAPEAGPAVTDGAAPVEEVSVDIGGRTWVLSIVPKPERLATLGWGADLTVPALGFSLSLLLALVVFQLLRRVRMVRQAHDATLRQIVERERAEAALRASEIRYRSVFASATDGLLVLDGDGTIIEANAMAAEMHRCTPEELEGVPMRNLLAPESRHLFKDYQRQLDRTPTARFDVIGQRADGTRLEIELRGSRLGSSGQRLAVLTDVTAQRKALRRLAQLTPKVLMAQEEERQRVSRELHDELGQLLTALQLEMGSLKRRTGQGEFFRNATGLVAEATQQLRRICRGLRPPVLDDLGIEPAVDALVGEFTEQTGIEVDLRLELPESLAPPSHEVALCVYRVVQEALHNVTRHAQATSVRVAVIGSEDGLEAEVCDDGCGFDVDSEVASRGCGLEGMRERAILVRGELSIESAPGHGCRVSLRVPTVKMQGEQGA